MASHQEVTMKCARCGELFKGNPRSQPLGSENYCSLMCERGNTPRAMSDPRSPDFHLHLKGNPEALVGKTLIANALKYVDYSANWCKGPEDWTPGEVIDHSEEDTSYVRKSDLMIGKVVSYDGEYHVEQENLETGEIITRSFNDMLVVDQLRQDRWWVEG